MELEGTLERITYQSDDDGYTVGRLTPQGKRYQVTIVGKLLGVRPGETLVLEGEWQEHRDHGRQFAVVQYRQIMPATIDGVKRYLGSGLIKGVGPATAERITATFGKYTLDVLEREPERLAEVPGLGRKKAALIRQAWAEQQRIKEVMLLLQELGLPTGMAVRIYKQYGDAAIQVVRGEPYRLADEVYGIGFLTADKIAAGIGVAHDDPQRIGAGLRHTLGAATEDGHCFLPAGELVRKAAAILGVGEGLVAACLADPAVAGEVEIIDPDPGAHAPPPSAPVYLKPLAMAETGVAAAVQRLARAPSDMAGFFRAARWPQVFAHLAERHRLRLSGRQQEAVVIALTEKVSVLTGGPGTGKTHSLRTIVQLLQSRGFRPLLASPTGRAAKRLSEATGAEAKTIHRLLEYAPGGGGQFRRNADYPLECDLLVIDEVSMLDVLLANHLLKAVPPRAHVLLVGDADQLPSVGPGRVLRDLLESGAVPSVHLDQIFRQAAGSGIAAAARQINAGLAPDFAGQEDLFFFNAPDPERCAALVVELVAERIPRRFGHDPRRDIQVLSPTHKGAAGVANLNKLLQEALNPARPGKPEKPFGTNLFRLGDRVIQQRNNYELDVFNGDIGVVAAIDLAEQLLTVRFEDGRDIAYDFAILDELALAYALSVHKSQGAEYPAVVVPLLMQHRAMLQRNLLYTALTRARSLAVLAGDRRAVAAAAADERTEERYSGLAGRLARPA